MLLRILLMSSVKLELWSSADLNTVHIVWMLDALQCGRHYT